MHKVKPLPLPLPRCFIESNEKGLSEKDKNNKKRESEQSPEECGLSVPRLWHSKLRGSRGAATARDLCWQSFQCLLCSFVALYDVLFSVLYIKQDLKRNNTTHHLIFFLFSYQNLGRRNCFCTIAFHEKFHSRCSAASDKCWSGEAAAHRVDARRKMDEASPHPRCCITWPFQSESLISNLWSSC